MFGKRIADSASIVVTIKIAIGMGRPLIAWSGTPNAKESDVIADISSNRNVRRYLDRLIKSNRIKADEAGTITVPAYLCVTDEDSGIVDDYKIELTLFGQEITEEISKDSALQVMFEAYVTSIDKMNTQLVTGLTTVNSNAKLTMEAMLKALPQMLAQSTSIADRQMGIIKETIDAERNRANEATDAVLRLVDNENKNQGSSNLEDILKTLIAAPAALEAIKRLFDLLSVTKPG